MTVSDFLKALNVRVEMQQRILGSAPMDQALRFGASWRRGALGQRARVRVRAASLATQIAYTRRCHLELRSVSKIPDLVSRRVCFAATSHRWRGWSERHA
jgi:hypothetical protein